MALSEKLRQAQERTRRARQLPGFLDRVRACTGISASEPQLLGEAERAGLGKGVSASATRPAAEGSERRTPGLSRSEAEDFAGRLSSLLKDRRVWVGFGPTPPGLVCSSLSAVLAAIPAFVAVGGWFSMYTEDGDPSLRVDLLMSGDDDNRHPEGSYEFALRGPLFDDVDLPELFTLPPRPETARERARAERSDGSPLGPGPGKLPG